MKAKKTVSALLAAATAVSALLAGNVTANAASAKMKLRTVSLGDIKGMNSFSALGDGYYAIDNADDPYFNFDIDEIIYIGEDELNSWRKTGKFSYKDVKLDFKTTDMQGEGGFTADGNYMQFVACDMEGYVTKRYIASHNKKNTAITTAYTQSGEDCYTDPNGYTVESKWNAASGAYTVTVIAPDGQQNGTKLTYKGGGEPWAYLAASNSASSKYVGYLMWQTDDDADGLDYKVCGVRKNGRLDTLYEGNAVSTMSFVKSDDNQFIWYEAEDSGSLIYRIYLADSKKTIRFRQKDAMISNRNHYYFTGTVGEVYGTRAIVSAVTAAEELSSEDAASFYLLAKLNNGSSPTPISAAYLSMSTVDGKIYLVQNEKGQWGYINQKGKELGWFDDAGAFNGDYAPVLKNGKAYLIDRSMKQVSEKIGAIAVGTYQEGLYAIDTGDDALLMTYKK